MKAVEKTENLEEAVMCRDRADNGFPIAAEHLKEFLDEKRESAELGQWRSTQGCSWNVPAIISLPVLDDPIKKFRFGIEVLLWLGRI